MSKYVPLSLLWPGVYSSYIVMQHLLLWMQRGVGKHRGRRGDIGLQVSTYHCLCFGLVFILLTYVCTYVPLILVTYICKYVPLSCFDLAWCQFLHEYVHIAKDRNSDATLTVVDAKRYVVL